MINDVRIKKVETYPDDRGYFREVIKEGEEVFAEVKQTSVTVTYSAVIKAFHWHRHQEDIWYVASGMARIVLYDQREDSSTYKETQVIVAGEDNSLVVRIPIGVVHGYQVLGQKPVMLFYHTTKAYDPSHPDEERIAWNDPTIGFDWSVKNR